MSDKTSWWCVHCGARHPPHPTRSGGPCLANVPRCPTCGVADQMADVREDVTVEINWRELHLIMDAAQNWARDNQLHLDKLVFEAIARRLDRQHPGLRTLCVQDGLRRYRAEVGDPPGADELPPQRGPGAVGHAGLSEVAKADIRQRIQELGAEVVGVTE